MSNNPYFRDKTTVVLHEDDRPVLDELRREGEPTYQTLRRVLREYQIIDKEVERVRSEHPDGPESEVEVHPHAD